MRITLLAAVGLVATSLNVATAEPPATRAAGFACRLAAVAEGEVGTRTGTMTAGPVLLADLPGVNSRTGVEYEVSTVPIEGEVVCGIQVNQGLHPNGAWAAMTSASGVRVVTMPPTLVSYTAGPGDLVALCTIWRVFEPGTGWRTMYYNAPTGGFTSTPADAECEPAQSNTAGGQPVEEAGTSDPPIRADAYGHIVITGDSSGLSFTTSDRFSDSFSCSFTSYSPVTVTCNPVFPNAVGADAFYCEYWIASAATSSAAGKVHGVASCLGNTGAPLAPGDAETDDVSGANGASSHAAAGYYDENVDVTDVVCVAKGINGNATPTANFRVDCYEPGLPAFVR